MISMWVIGPKSTVLISQKNILKCVSEVNMRKLSKLVKWSEYLLNLEPFFRRNDLFCSSTEKHWATQKDSNTWFDPVFHLIVIFECSVGAVIDIVHSAWCHVPVMMSSMAPSFPSLTRGDTCLFFSSAIRSTCCILDIMGTWKMICKLNIGQ